MGPVWIERGCGQFRESLVDSGPEKLKFSPSREQPIPQFLSSSLLFPFFSFSRSHSTPQAEKPSQTDPDAQSWQDRCLLERPAAYFEGDARAAGPAR